MALQKEKTLPSGVTGNYWRVSGLRFTRGDMQLDMTISLYKDGTPGLAPLGAFYTVRVTLSPQDLLGNLVAMAYTKIKDYANSDVPNTDGNGTHKGIADLADSIDV